VGYYLTNTFLIFKKEFEEEESISPLCSFCKASNFELICKECRSIISCEDCFIKNGMEECPTCCCRLKREKIIKIFMSWFAINRYMASFEGDGGDVAGPPVQTQEVLGLLLQTAAHLVPTEIGADVGDGQTVPHEEGVELQPIVQRLPHPRDHVFRLRNLRLFDFG
jgi:hypothetical protein